MKKEDKEMPVTTTVIGGVTQDPHLKEGDKYFVYNQTGNIMVSTTRNPDTELEEGVRSVFNEVSVFFAAMTKSITTTVNPLTGGNYSIYNYDALERIIAGSGCFVEVTKERVHYSTTTLGATFSRDLLVGLLGLPGAGAMTFAASMLAGVGKEGLSLSGYDERNETRVGSLIFVCEYLMGMPCVTATLLSVDTQQACKVFDAGPCIHAEQSSQTLDVYKETFFFVTPAYIRRYAGDLDSLIGNSEYGEFISFLKSLLAGKAYLHEVTDDKDQRVTVLHPGQAYKLKGSGFGISGKLLLGGNGVSCTSWDDSVICFTLPENAAEGEQALTVQDGGGNPLVEATVSVKAEA